MSTRPTKGRPPTRTYGQSGRQRRKEAEEAARKHRTRVIAFISVLAIFVVAAIAGAIALSGGNHSGSAASNTTVTTVANSTATTAVAENPGPETAPIPGGSPLALATTPGGATVDGIQCPVGSGEATAYHIHIHLAIFINGTQVQVPAGIGIPNAQNSTSSGDAFVGATVCYYWLHTHAADGIIHVEAPTTKLYTLGNFFDLWGQPLGPNQVGPQKGLVTAFLNGKSYTGDPRTIVLTKHAVIQLDVGEPIVPFQSFSQWGQL